MTPRHRRLSRLFAADGRCLVVALDHAGFMDKPLRGLEAPGPVLSAAVAAGANAFLLTLGSAERYAAELGRAGLWLSVEADPRLAEPMVAEALRLGADGVKCLVYPGWEARPNSLADFSALALACRAWNLPVMAEVIPGGFLAGPEQRTPAAIAAGARVAFEAGADVIKTVYTGTPESFAMVLAYLPGAGHRAGRRPGRRCAGRAAERPRCAGRRRGRRRDWAEHLAAPPARPNDGRPRRAHSWRRIGRGCPDAARLRLGYRAVLSTISG